VSRTLTEAEKRYAPIEKEMLAVTYVCTRLGEYLIGKRFQLFTDHKPLEAIFKKPLADLTPRLQRLRMRLLAFDCHVSYLPGKENTTADYFSRNAVKTDVSDVSEIDMVSDADYAMVKNVSDKMLLNIVETSREDPVMQSLREYVKTGWPASKHDIPGVLHPYSQFRDYIGLQGDLLVYHDRVIIPPSMRRDVLDKLHTGHQGIAKCRARARATCWWPGMGVQLEETVKSCRHCSTRQQAKQEPLKPSEFPEGPWMKVATDVGEFRKLRFLVIVDYYSRFFEVHKLESTSSSEIIEKFNKTFARFGVPETVVADNAAYYRSGEIVKYAERIGTKFLYSAPYRPQENGLAEKYVGVVKSLLKTPGSFQEKLLALRATPLANGFSPAELLFGRKLRTPVPALSKPPIWVKDMNKIQDKELAAKIRAKANYDEKHRAQPLSPLAVGTHVMIRGGQVEPRSGIVVEKTGERTYRVFDGQKTLVRSRPDLQDHTYSRVH
jgi:transposase InsO family protein